MQVDRGVAATAADSSALKKEEPIARPVEVTDNLFEGMIIAVSSALDNKYVLALRTSSATCPGV
jgi:hypothetical protein